MGERADPMLMDCKHGVDSLRWLLESSANLAGDDVGTDAVR
jgi:hypothetical protein